MDIFFGAVIRESSWMTKCLDAVAISILWRKAVDCEILLNIIFSCKGLARRPVINFC